MIAAFTEVWSAIMTWFATLFPVVSQFFATTTSDGKVELNLSTYYDDIDYLQHCTFTINFKVPFLYDQSKNTLFFSGDLIGLTEYVTIIMPNGEYKTFNINGSSGSLSGALLNTNINSILISKIELTVGRPTDLGKFWLNSVNTGIADYNYGYNIGFEDGKLEGNKTFYDKGYSAGFQEGFNQNESGGFGWLISSVQQFLDVKFFGDFGIGTLLYVSLGVLCVMYFLKLVAGG